MKNLHAKLVFLAVCWLISLADKLMATKAYREYILNAYLPAGKFGKTKDEPDGFYPHKPEERIYFIEHGVLKPNPRYASSFRVLKVADYTYTPGARTERETPGTSADRFFHTYLKYELAYAMRWANRLVLDLDGTNGYGASFLDELARLIAKDFKFDWVKRWMAIKCSDEIYLEREFFRYLKQNYGALNLSAFPLKNEKPFSLIEGKTTELGKLVY